MANGFPIIDKKVCPNPDCNEAPLILESEGQSGEVSPRTGEMLPDEKHEIYRCNKCGKRYTLKID